MSENPPVHKALADVMDDVREVAKTEYHDSPQAKFRFRGIDATVNAVGPALRDHGVVVAPIDVDVHYRDVTTSTGKASRECTVKVTYRFHGPAGDCLDVMVPGESLDTGDKGTAKAMSVAYRIALLQALSLPTGERDPDHDAYERVTPEQTESKPDANELRSQIAQWGTDNNIGIDKLAADFKERAKQDITEADTRLLEHFLGHLRTHGMRAEQPQQQELAAEGASDE